MKKTLLASVLGLGLGLASFSAMAFDDSVSLAVDGKPLVIQEVSGRVLGNAEGTQAVLVDDIFAGQGKKAVPGYQVMFMGRTSSVAVEAKKTADGKYVDDRMIHRGVESTDQCNTCVKTSYFDHFLVGNYGTHETVVYQAR